MNIGDIIHGFRITNARTESELNGTLWEMVHERTGAQLIWLDNGEENKLFSVAFKTLPSDDTGVFHILEHSVLCGSQKYPVKEPFVDLLKSSMNTFLNAMTFADKTMYPVSSRNEADFLNLMSVYLDAVFCPAIYTNPSIFYQEGWHYELHEGDEMPIYKGVVFNEMKGALSSEDAIIERELNRLLYPDSCYRFVSGGDPEHIPELTYENFIASHREFYSPSNARIYLDGSIPLEKVLQIIDEEYFANCEVSSVKHEIVMQQPVEAASTVAYYDFSGEEEPVQKSHMALGKIITDWSDRKRTSAIYALTSYLAGSNESPLKRAILDTGLAQDIYFYLDDSVAQPVCALQIRNTEYEHRDALKNVIVQTVQSLIDSGLDAEELNAAINQMEWSVLELHEPSGLYRNINMLNSWLHGGDPMLYLLNRELFASLRAEVGTGYYEALLGEMLLDNAHTAEVYLLPSKTKGEEDRVREQQEIAAAAASWSEEDRADVIAKTAALEQWQSSEDTPEALATLPTLTLDEVSDTPADTPTEELDINGVKVLYHAVSSNGIVHFNLYFNISDFEIDSIPAISFMTNLLGELPTKKHSAAQLRRLVKSNIGRITYNASVFGSKDNREETKICFEVSMSALESSIDTAVELLVEILTETDWKCEQAKSMINEILVQCEDILRQTITLSGNAVGVKRVLSHFSARCLVNEMASGYEFYNFIRTFARDYDARYDEFIAIAEHTCAELDTGRAVISMTSTEKCEAVKKIITAFTGRSSNRAPEYVRIVPDYVAAREAIQIPAGISYAVSGGDLSIFDTKYDSALKVLSSILTFSYLWNEVRVQGGAYGCGYLANLLGNSAFYSYRDPDPSRSLKVFANTSQFIRQYCESDEALDKFIISSIASLEPLKTPREQGYDADTEYILGLTYEDRLARRRRMLSLTKEDLLEYCELFDKMAQGNAICVVGHEGALQNLGEEFTILKL